MGKYALNKIAQENRAALQQYTEHLQLKAHSPSTIKTNMVEFAQLLYVLQSFPVATLTPDRLRSIKTTQLYTHVAQVDLAKIVLPLDALSAK